MRSGKQQWHVALQEALRIPTLPFMCSFFCLFCLAFLPLCTVGRMGCAVQTTLSKRLARETEAERRKLNQACLTACLFFLVSVLVRRSFAACADAAFSSLMAHVYLVIGCGFIASDTAQDSKVTICATLGCFEKSFQPRGRYASSRAPAN